MYEIGISGQFEAAHQLRGDFGPATRMHGHTYRIDVIVRGGELAEDGALVDIGMLQKRLDELTGRLHYQNLDEVPGLAEVNTTAEAVAHYCWEQLAPTLRGRGLDSLRVQIWENPSAYAAREDDLD